MPPTPLIVRLALLAASWLALPITAHAQVVNILYSFQGGADGDSPYGALVRGTNGNFYGTTLGAPRIFEITPQGSLTILHNFSDGSIYLDGTQPFGALVQGSDGAFYGTTSGGGLGSEGTVFKVTQNGTYTVLHNFADGTVTTDGMAPYAGLLLGPDGNFYGTTTGGGTTGLGTIFKMTPQGVVTIFHSFGASVVDVHGNAATDGSAPECALIQGSDGNFYGTTAAGGSGPYGTVFKITPQGTVTILHSFGDGSVPNDGVDPSAGLVQGTDGNFYGTTQGTIFKITPQGVLSTLHHFGDPNVLNDGTLPASGETLLQGADGNFYGTTLQGGSTAPLGGVAGSGGIFRISPQGDYTFLHSFGDGSITNDGASPESGFVQGPNGLLFGVTSYGGADASPSIGIVYTLNPAAPLITSSTAASGALTVPFSYQVVATNNPTSYTATNLPDGLSIGATTGLISGTPTTVQTKAITLTTANASSSSTITLTITIGAAPVPAITSILTAYGSVGTMFTYNTTATNNPTSFSADAASLTSLAGKGLSFDPSTGVISGNPTSSGTISVNLTATNTLGTGASSVLSIQILSAPATLSDEYNILYDFGSVTNDGTSPQSILQAFDGNFYGVTSQGGSSGEGAVFKMDAQGVESIFYSFEASTSSISSPTSLIQAADGNFYGTTTTGHVFRLTLTGQLSILHYFSLPNGGVAVLNPLVQGFDGNFYGTTAYDGTASCGTAFKLTPQGVYTLLHNFGDVNVTDDGRGPRAGLVQGSDGNFYGTTEAGGSTASSAGLTGDGVVFRMTPQGAVQTLHSFNFGGGPSVVDLNGTPTNDGSQASTSLIQGTDGNFYGTTPLGGASAYDGMFFRMTPDGTITVLHSFGTFAGDGENPEATPLLGYDGNFYGTTQAGGANGDGTIYQLTPQGVLTILHSFGDPTVPGDANYAYSALIQSTAGNFYGTSQQGGAGYGTVFSIQAMQTPTHVPIYIGAAYQEASVFGPFSFTPKAFFGVSGSGNVQTNAVQPQTSGGIMDALVSLFVPQSIHKNYSITNWTLDETGVGLIPPNTLQPLYLTFDPTSGTISGTPIQGGSFALTITPGNIKGLGAPMPVTIYIDVPPDISSAAAVNCVVGTMFNYQIASTPPADSYSAPNLPVWLSVDPVGGLITGTPPAAGTYVFNTIASNLSGQTVQPVSLTVTGGSSSVPTITSSTVASGSVGAPFTYHITTAHAATALTALIPPCGLAFDATSGTIIGTPNAAGFYQIPITAANASGSSASVLSLTVTPPTAPTIASSLLAVAAEGNPFTYAIPTTGVVSTYAETGALPMGLMFNASTGVISGTPTETGTFPLGITITNATGMATSNLVLKVETSIDYGHWTTTNGVSGGANGAPKNDAVPNLLKYFCDIIPSAAISDADRAALPAVGAAIISGTECQTLTFRQSALAGGLNINVQTSPNLRTWTTIATEPSTSIVQVGTDSITGDPIYQAQIPFTSTPQFIRLNVTQP